MMPVTNPETKTQLVWLASYPRSGNTLLRTIMFQCFGLRSASIYLNDLGGRHTLEDWVGHIEHDGGRINFGDQQLWLIKTHAPPNDTAPAIYVIRDGRDATISLSHFDDVSLREVVEGRHKFRTWAAHVNAWSPATRPNTLLLRYEEMTADLPAVLDRIAGFLGVPAVRRTLPSREELAETDGKWIRPHGAAREELVGDLLHRFWQINGEVMRQYGYD